MKVAFGKLKMGIIQLLGWFCKFTSGITPYEEYEHSGHTSVSTWYEDADWVKELVFKTRKIRIHKVTNILETSSPSVQTILDNSQNVCQTTSKGVLCLCCMWMKFRLKTEWPLFHNVPAHQIQWLLSFLKTKDGVKPSGAKRWL